MEKQIRHNQVFMIILLLISLVCSCFILNYIVGKVSDAADIEALAHITENTEQLNYSLTSRINDTWATMDMADMNLSGMGPVRTDEAVQYLHLIQEETKAVRVYLLSDDGGYLDSNANTGRWEFDEDMLPLIRDHQSICRLRQLSTGGDFLDFAIPITAPVTDQNYQYLMMEYELDTFLEVLSLRSYGGKGVAYVLDDSGRTLFKTNGDLTSDQAENDFFFRFLKGMKFTGNSAVTDIESLRSEMEAGNSGAVYASDDTHSYAVSFQPLKPMDWHLVLMVERSAIAGGRVVYMQQVKWISIAANVLIMLICLGLYMANTLRLRKRSALQLSSRERIIEVLSTDSMGAYILIDANTKNCTFVSQSIEGMVGIAPADLLGNSLKKLLDVLNHPELVQALREWDNQKTLESGRFVFRGEQSGDKKHLRIRVFPPQNGETVMAILDETADAQKERALEDAVSAARSANRAKSTFLSNMSHDIRTPMNAIIGYATLAVANISNPDRLKDYLSKILSSGNHLLSLINDVLDMSRIESGRIHLEETEANLSDILHDIKTIVSGQIHAKQLELYMDTLDVTDEDIYCDKTRLNQVLLNLISNAIKFTSPGGTVSVRVAQIHNAPAGKGIYEIHIKDTGIGMSPEFVKKIFEPFERESSSTVSRIQGSGLGMAISKNIIDMMGGTIRVITEKGKGTEFIIRLTLRLQSERRVVRKIEELEGLKALVADDDFNTCDSITKMLIQVGMRSEWTMSGKEAVLRSKQAQEMNDAFHAYIIDWRLPDMNGIEVTRQIRRSVGDSTPIIILTAYDWSEIESEAREAGVTAFCAKPMFLSDLRESLLVSLGKQVPKKVQSLPASDHNEVFRNKRILVAEDNELNREIAVELLGEYGFMVETAEDGASVVKKIADSAPGYYDLILMDIQMPIMDGYETTRQIRALENPDLADIPVLAMTANAFEEDRQKALAAGMNGFLSKPINIEQMIGTLHTVFNGK